MVVVSKASSSLFHGNWVTCRVKAIVMSTNQCTKSLIILERSRVDTLKLKKLSRQGRQTPTASRGKPKDHELMVALTLIYDSLIACTFIPSHNYQIYRAHDKKFKILGQNS